MTIPKIFENKTSRCPVAIFKFFISKRPPTLRNNGPFYLAVIDNPATNIWFKVSPMGANSINNIMKNMKLKSPLSNSTKRLTNHSARKTVVKKLKNAQVPRSEIVGITGHANEAGLDDYDSGDEFQQRKISFAIDGNKNKSRLSENVNLLASNIIAHNVNSSTRSSFNFFPEGFWDNPSAHSPFKIPASSTYPIQQPTYNFNNCSINITNNTTGTTTSEPTRPKKTFFDNIL